VVQEGSLSNDLHRELIEKIEAKQAHVAVIGLGYVGLPLAVEFASAGLMSTGIDLNQEKVDLVNAGTSYLADVADEEVAAAVNAGALTATTDFGVLAAADCVCICVPTPLGKTKDPDISYIVAASDEIARYFHPGLLVVLESTTYPGTTEELILQRLDDNGGKVGEDFFVAFSPERVDPGNAVWKTKNTPKVIGGMTPACTKVAVALYQNAVDTLVPVSSPAAAEMVKLLENTFRAVNIGLVNEIALICDRLELNVWEIIDAAATKPFGYMKFTPGPGLGGHCIPIDPLYLSWKMRGMNYEARFIDLADKVNAEMPHHVARKVMDALNDEGKALKGARILVLGVAYKAGTDDVRESPAVNIIELLRGKGAEVSYHDPHVSALQLESGEELASVELSNIDAADCAVLVTNHDEFDANALVESGRLIVDTRNALGSVSGSARVVGL
jgi:UDP-N-acetyl-D-glucosamine dehydrogenase